MLVSYSSYEEARMARLLRITLNAGAGGLIGMAIACFSGHFYYQMAPYVIWGAVLGGVGGVFVSNRVVAGILGAVMGSYAGSYAAAYLAVAVNTWQNPHFDPGYYYTGIVWALLGGVIGAAFGGGCGLLCAKTVRG
jgi:uncharacterized membrane protein